MPRAEVVGRYRWVVCALLFFATTVNYIDRQILSLLKPILDKELGWTNAEFGAVNAAFQGAYKVPGGALTAADFSKAAAAGGFTGNIIVGADLASLRIPAK